MRTSSRSNVVVFILISFFMLEILARTLPFDPYQFPPPPSIWAYHWPPSTQSPNSNIEDKRDDDVDHNLHEDVHHMINVDMTAGNASMAIGMSNLNVPVPLTDSLPPGSNE